MRTNLYYAEKSQLFKRFVFRQGTHSVTLWSPLCGRWGAEWALLKVNTLNLQDGAWSKYFPVTAVWWCVASYNMMTSSNGNIFRVTGPLWRNPPVTGGFPHKGQWGGTFMFSLISIHLNSLIMTSSNGSIFRVTGLLCGEFKGDRWIPLRKASDAELWCFLWSAPE